MSSIFNYNSFEVRLEKSTRSLWVTLNNPPVNYFSTELLFELESLLAWCTGKVEIHSIVFQSRNDRFSEGIDQELLKSMDRNKLETYCQKWQKINQSLMLLPQIVIVDMGMGTKNIASEFITACDIRIAHRACKVSFEHAQIGLVACSGGMAQLSLIAGHANAKNWLLSGSEININKLESCGFVYGSYTQDTRHFLIEELLHDIHIQAPIQRIQTKMGVIENVREQAEKLYDLERKIAKAAMISEDWKAGSNTNEVQKEPMPAKHMQQAVKLSLVKNTENQEG